MLHVFLLAPPMTGEKSLFFEFALLFNKIT